MNKRLLSSTVLRPALYLFLLVLVASGCNKEEEPNILHPDGKPVYFSSVKQVVDHNNSGNIRATGTQWDENDWIGLFAVTNQSVLEPGNIVDNNENLQFETNGDGFFYAKGKYIYYPRDGSSMDIIAYYPYTASLDDNYTYPIDITQQTDLFFSNNLKGLSKNNHNNRDLVFTRPLANLLLRIAPVNEENSLDGLNVTLSGAKTKATFSLSTGEITIDDNSMEEFGLSATNEGNGKEISAFLLPTEEADELVLRFKLGDDTFEWSVPHALKPGKRYTYTIKLKGGKPAEVTAGYMEIPLYAAADKAPYSIQVTHMIGNINWLAGATGDVSNYRNYTVLFDTQNRIPYWVAFPLHPIYLGTGRYDAWQYDPSIPEAKQPLLQSGYNSGWDRGHMLASADRNATRELNHTTFYYTNMVPQNNSMNGGTWAALENKVRAWSEQTTLYDTLYVVTGAILPEPPEQFTYTFDNLGKQVAVPKYLYKALLRKKKSNGDYSSIAFKMENRNTGIAYTQSILSVAELENETGFTFFTGLPAEVAPSVKQNNSISPDWN